ncbi:MAG: flagellar hook basal-body protein [Myxococcales bacterium]|nr:flagellar hook basal-body protein [Myxococcales bacterium]
MSSNLYVSAAGAMARLTQLDLVANNLANAGTTGYKRDGAMFESVLQNSLTDSEGEIVLGAPGLNFVRSYGIGSDFEAGSIEKTGVPLDFAILGPGFLEIQTDDGPRYTRSGSLKVDAAGNLTTRDGQLVAGIGGPIQASGIGVHVSSSGQILDGANVELDRLKIVEFENLLELKKGGSQRYEALEGANPTQVERPTLVPQSLEGSNVNTVLEMSTLVILQRAFEANIKILQADDDATKRLIREVRG